MASLAAALVASVAALIVGADVTSVVAGTALVSRAGLVAAAAVVVVVAAEAAVDDAASVEGTVVELDAAGTASVAGLVDSSERRFLAGAAAAVDEAASVAAEVGVTSAEEVDEAAVVLLLGASLGTAATSGVLDSTGAAAGVEGAPGWLA